MIGPMRKTTKRAAFRLITIAVVVATIVIGDIVVGFVDETALLREHARLFREEAALLRVGTLNLVPGVHQVYSGVHRPEGDQLIPTGAPRLMRTDERGTIESGNVQDGTTVLFLGGSTTECNEVDESFRFPAVVEELLRSAGAAITVMNGGVRGHTSQDSINALLNRPGFRDADIVVMMHNINDRLRLAVRGGYEAELGEIAPTSGDAVGAAFRDLISIAWDWASYRSNSLFLLRTHIGQLSPFAGETDAGFLNEIAIDFEDERLEQNIREFEDNLRVFIAAARSLGKTPVLMTQPIGVESTEHQQFNDLIRNVSLSEEAHLVDLVYLLGQDNQWAFLSDNIHLNNRGSATLGSLIAEEIAPLFGASSFPMRTSIGPLNPLDLLDRCKPPSSDMPANYIIRLVSERFGRYPSFSPDGRYLFYQSFSGGLDRLMAFDLIEEHYFDISPPGGTFYERHPAFLEFTADGFRVVFGSSQGQGTFETLMVRDWPALTTEALPVGGLGGAIPTVNGRSIIFPGFMRTGPDSVPNLYNFDLNTASLYRLTQADVEQWRPAVDQHGTVYFIEDGEGSFDLIRLQAGGIPEVFIDLDADIWDPTVSPDGRWVAFAATIEGSWDIYLTGQQQGSQLIRITSWSGDEWDPTFDPSGQLLVFAASSGSAPQLFGLCLYGETGASPMWE